MRVIAGELKGHRLVSPRGGVRPTSDKVREALFSILGDVSEARVLDLFAGTGALAIEALSRGAAQAVLVDRDVEAARRNVEQLGLEQSATIVSSEVLKFLKRPATETFDLVLCDPPYRLADRLAPEMDSLLPPHLAPGARIAVETAAREPLPLSLRLLRERRYGDTLIRIHAGGEEA